MPTGFRLMAFLCLVSIPLDLGAAEPAAINLWPGVAPGETGDIGPEGLLPARPNATKKIDRLGNVSVPTMTVYQPPADKRTGTTVVVCPGGGYSILAMDLEGTEVCEWLNSIGVTAVLVKYRVPRRKNRPKHEAPLQDAQRAVSIVRSRAEEWGINPERIGILGFSAGGHLSATTSTNSDQRAYDAIDEHDKASCRPDFAVLVYPAYLVDDKTGKLMPEIRVDKNSPPTFFAHAHDDGISPLNSALMYAALKKAGVPSELHIFTQGGHGFGLRPTDQPCSKWPQHCEAWMRVRKLIP